MRAPEMRFLLNLVTISCLCIITESALNTFPEKCQQGSSVTLSCDKATESPVTWMFDGQDLEEDDVVELKGNTVKLLDLDIDLTGNFTCWSEKNEVDYTYVLLDLSDTITDSPVSCTAETFNCISTISCSMSEKGYNHFRLREESDWVTPSADGSFTLTHTTNPFAEEAKPIVVFGEAVSTLKHYFKTRYSFYIREIIRPGCPRVSVLGSSSGKVVNVSPPVSWTLPLSYYPLEHEIQFLKRTDGKRISIIHPPHSNLDSVGSVAVPAGSSKVRARCRDPVLPSQWSEWTVWQNVSH